MLHGPLTPRNLPARRMTNFSQVFAIFSEAATMIAAIAKGIPKKGVPSHPVQHLRRRSDSQKCGCRIHCRWSLLGKVTPQP
jgi:hypothetical protein